MAGVCLASWAHMMHLLSKAAVMTALMAAVPLTFTTGSPAGAAQARSTAANVLSIGYGDSLRVSAIGQVITMQLGCRLTSACSSA